MPIEDQQVSYRGFARVSAAVPECGVADLAGNASRTLELWQRAHEQQSSVVIFPELGLCAYSVRDLLLNRQLQDAVLRQLERLAQASRLLRPLALVGLPLRFEGALYNVAVAIQGGRLLGAVPKSYLPSYREFEEARWFRPGHDIVGASVSLCAQQVALGTDLLFEAANQPELVVGVEICEDAWVQCSPGAYQVGAGATVVCNLSASNFTLGKSEVRRRIAASASSCGKCAYVYVAAGPGESSTDLAFDADAFIYENGEQLCASQRFARQGQLMTADVDLQLLQHERISTGSFADCAVRERRAFRRLSFEAAPFTPPLRRGVSAKPFLPNDTETLSRRCWEVFEIQSNALATRMRGAGIEKLVLGLSGGIDSTHAALVAVNALSLLNLPRSNLHCVGLPGLGTSERTRDNAEALCRALGVSAQIIDIVEATHLVLGAVEHQAVQGVEEARALVSRLQQRPQLGDVALENVQARLRTLLLMTLANQNRGMVIGTGDLSEKALGWSTYAGDQIAMYDVNAGVPKTLIQFVIRWVCNERLDAWGVADSKGLRSALSRILDTPISPELLPPTELGGITQRTEDTVGPFELHDFFLYHFVRHGAGVGRILDLAQIAFAGSYDLGQLKHWLRVFLGRFFSNQFKRSCTPDAAKVGPVALSPRGDWRMPSDATVGGWLTAVDNYEA